ncbi:MAG: ComF family protein [Patescibacteria group bacterium]
MINGIMSAATYDAGPTKEIIHHLKYSGFVDLAGILGELLVERLLLEAIPDNCVIVSVPLSLKRKAERGFNQSELIGKYVSNKLGIPGCDALSRIKDQKPQATLKRNERLSNLTGVFRVEDDEFVHGKNVLLIDDVATTGTTLNECAKVLKAAGAKKVYGVVVAHG